MQVVFPKVLAPVTDTVNLVDNKSVDFVCTVKFIQYSH